MAQYLDSATVDALWRDGRDGNWDAVSLYVDAAEAAVLAYAPRNLDGTPAVGSAALQVAIVMQARNLYNSAKASPSTGEFDGSGFGLTTMPLDWQIKQLLRPQRGMGAIV